MTIGKRTPGAWASGSTTVTPALPASPAAGDMMILFVGCKPYTATINQPTGWTRIGTQQTNGSTGSGIDTGSVTWSVFYRAWQSGDAAPSVSVTSGNVSLAVIHGYTKTAGAWVTPTAYFGSDTTSGTGYSITAASSSGNITSGDSLLHATVIAGNDATFGTPTLTATSATIGTVTESPATEGTTTTGNDLEASSATADCTAGTSSADAVCGWTLSAAQTGGSALVRLREDFTIVAAGIPSAEAIGAAAVGATVVAAGIASAEAIGAAAVGATVVATGIASAEAIGAAAVGATVVAAGIASAEALGQPTVGTPHTIDAIGIVSAEAFGSPVVSAGIAPSAIASVEAFGQPTVSAGIAPAAIASAEGFGAATVAAGVAASGIGSVEAFGAATVSAWISTTGMASAEALGAPEVGAAIVAAGVASAEALGQPGVGAIIVPAGIASAEALGLPTVAAVTAAVPADDFDYLQLLRDPNAPPRLARMAGHMHMLQRARQRARR